MMNHLQGSDVTVSNRLAGLGGGLGGKAGG